LILTALKTPKAFANFSPGLLQPWEQFFKADATLKALAMKRNDFDIRDNTNLANAYSVPASCFFLTQG
jgi:hypothetical protein